MQEENRILELLAEVLRKQDQGQQETREIRNVLGQVEGRLGQVEGRLDEVVENQVIHQQVLRTLATGQQSNQKALEEIFVLLDSVTRVQRDQSRRLDRLENPDVAA